jgi:hypothetical protein
MAEGRPPDSLNQSLAGAFCGLFQQRFDLGESVFDRLEIR